MTKFVEDIPSISRQLVEPSSIARRFDRLVDRIGEAQQSALAGLVRREKLTYLPPRKLRVVEDCLRHVQRSGVPGDFLEFGVALGGSAIVIASQMEKTRQFHGYDAFDMIPPPGTADDERSHRRYREIRDGRAVGIGGDIYDGYQTDLYERVTRAFERIGLRVDNDRIHASTSIAGSLKIPTRLTTTAESLSFTLTATGPSLCASAYRRSPAACRLGYIRRLQRLWRLSARRKRTSCDP